ncbi:MAG: D-alanyl-D-alaninecarboxypeptidase/D-alanyl-D-alanine-endopeptidase [Sediminibacterium sp.]|nr:D-alanyl-D-alaninecarboxypeptidase/D-alanyl-D-alanine-endopeptidase [Sediminibacterium sp.]
MKRTFVLLVCLGLCSLQLPAQTVREKLAAATQRLLADPQMKHAILGLSVSGSQAGESIFEVNAQVGLAPASCQKTITSAAAMELLGPAYRYRTTLGYDGTLSKGILKGNLYLLGSGDPSLGSWRYDSTKEEKIINGWLRVLKQRGIQKIDGSLIGCTGTWDTETLPGGWIWDDIGNYYGAGSSALNWRENQYDLVLRSGKTEGDTVAIVRTQPKLYTAQLQSELLSAAKGTGDNAYIYLPPTSTRGVVRGTIPVDEQAFVISGSFPDPPAQLLATLNAKLDSVKLRPHRFYSLSSRQVPAVSPVQVYLSPSLDSLNYWFMKKSINLYGEALLKTMAFEQTGVGSTDKGVELLKKFWQERGIEPGALRIIDGSGLSPQNRVTTDALVKVLQYARSRPWFGYYYDALPVFNQMKLKSGTIGGAKSFAGYHTAKDGTVYTVAMIINNYEGSAGEIVKKMFQVLDELK